MDIKLLGELAKRNPALARSINLGIMSFCLTFLTSLISYLETGEGLNVRIALIALLLPILAGLEKRFRDLNN